MTQVKEFGPDPFEREKSFVKLHEMKYAENEGLPGPPTAWTLKVYKQLSQILLDILELEDYIVMWGGLSDPIQRTVELNSNGLETCYLAIYRHNVSEIL